MGNFANFVNPETIGAISLGERIITSLFVTLLGMGITFVALIAIWGMTVLMSKIIINFENKNKIADAKTVQAAKAPAAAAAVTAAPAAAEAPQEDENLIAVLTAAVAASLNTSMHNIIVRKVRQLPDQTPSWSRAGRAEQMGSRF